MQIVNHNQESQRFSIQIHKIQSVGIAIFAVVAVLGFSRPGLAATTDRSSGPGSSNRNPKNLVDEMVEKLLGSIDKNKANLYLRFQGSIQPLEIKEFAGRLDAVLSTKGQPLVIRSPIAGPVNSAIDFSPVGILDIDQRMVTIEIKPVSSLSLNEFEGSVRFINLKSKKPDFISLTLQTNDIDIHDLQLDELKLKVHLPTMSTDGKKINDPITLRNKIFGIILECKARNRVRNLISGAIEYQSLEYCEFEYSDNFYINFREKLPNF